MLLLVVASIATLEWTRLWRSLPSAGLGRGQQRETLGTAAVAGSLLSLVILMDSLPSMSGAFLGWFAEIQRTYYGELPTKWDLFRRQAEVLLIAANLVRIVWRGAARSAMARVAPPRPDDVSSGRDWDGRPKREFVLRAGAFVVGMLLIPLARAATARDGSSGSSSFPSRERLSTSRPIFWSRASLDGKRSLNPNDDQPALNRSGHRFAPPAEKKAPGGCRALRACSNRTDAQGCQRRNRP